MKAALHAKLEIKMINRRCSLFIFKSCVRNIFLLFFQINENFICFPIIIMIRVFFEFLKSSLSDPNQIDSHNIQNIRLRYFWFVENVRSPERKEKCLTHPVLLMFNHFTYTNDFRNSKQIKFLIHIQRFLYSHANLCVMDNYA